MQYSSSSKLQLFNKVSICLSLSILLSLSANQIVAQTLASPSPVTDKTIIDPLLTDFEGRHATIPDIVINWFNSDYGYYGIYVINEQTFMIRYDKDGSYIETLTKKAWDSEAPSSLKTSLSKSDYKDQSVTSYWEVIDASKSTCLIQLNNGIEIWGNARGSFSRVPGQ